MEYIYADMRDWFLYRILANKNHANNSKKKIKFFMCIYIVTPT